MSKPAASQTPRQSRRPSDSAAPPERDALEDELDEALKDTFPASDPIAVDPDVPDRGRGGGG
ncbi:hypothetical protein CURE108131_01555 [Cupriavidus respiraculi]|uniref:Uncharacterized protein n=1 Tax=Cupriavidus respiraculi TaxID=195930 RepID=A0ABM8WEH8_9BURK|nr:hypothetical protein [Cupriavidus respiraculi]MBY4947647.1 hypothetical protein [Cupriavidus respiraculi]CAG9165723.1 hypothetical protein LMG21510_00183 [Cupriavidus respiraculi]